MPPPLPPRLPNRNSQSDLLPRSANQSELTSRSGNQSERSDKVSQSERSADLYSQSKRFSSSKNPDLLKQSSSKKLAEPNFDAFSSGGLNCSTPQPLGILSSSKANRSAKQWWQWNLWVFVSLYTYLFRFFLLHILNFISDKKAVLNIIVSICNQFFDLFLFILNTILTQWKLFWFFCTFSLN